MMKKIIGLILAAFIYSVSFSASASSSGDEGGFVDCKLPDGSVQYVPAMYCQLKKGKFSY